MISKERQWLSHFGELIDRLCIHQLKEVNIPEHKDKYSTEMVQIMNDIDLLIQQMEVKASAELIRATIVLAQINTHIWNNESRARKGEAQDLKLLELTHGLNGIRNQTQNFILELIGQLDRKDYKTDCLAAEFKDWEISLDMYGKESEDANISTG